MSLCAVHTVTLIYKRTSSWLLWLEGIVHASRFYGIWKRALLSKMLIVLSREFHNWSYVNFTKPCVWQHHISFEPYFFIATASNLNLNNQSAWLRLSLLPWKLDEMLRGAYIRGLKARSWQFKSRSYTSCPVGERLSGQRVQSRVF